MVTPIFGEYSPRWGIEANPCNQLNPGIGQTSKLVNWQIE